jgi:UDP-GlcNAc:undecaprenyl-phosphate/decaprenyl-phosphate GlcNAc-1-phosphate transferase
MTEAITYPIITIAVSAVLAAVLTFATRALARRFNFVAKPKSDRWHKRPTAMLGGAAIFAATLLMYAVAVPRAGGAGIVLGAASFLFLVGLLDDLINIKPYQKLIGQLIGATFVVWYGLRLPLTGYELVDIWITVFWLVGITNAINLLDNMDGLAAGIAAIATISLAVGFFANGQVAEGMLAAVFIGALIGFLVFNFNPASIFMGDCGSMFVGFLLAGTVLLGQTGGRSRSIFTILAVPVLILFVPIFDTTFVTILRKLWGRKASQGGRDHTSHRLVALGLTERSAVLLLYGLAAGAGALSLLVAQLETTQSLALIGLFTVLLTIVGVYLSKVKVYEEREENIAFHNNAVFAFIVNVSYKRRVFEVVLDSFLITLSYYAAYVLVLGPIESTTNWGLFINTLPILLVVKLFALLAAGAYRGLWRYTSVSDLLTFVKGVTIGSVASVVAVLLLYRFQNFSRAVFVVDGLILLFAVVGSRLAFRLFREVLPVSGANGGRRVLIYGAGDGGELVLRELRNNPAWNYSPVGFIDDDPLKKGKVINGLQVYDSNGTLAELCAEKDVEEVLISSRKIAPETVRSLRSMCRDRGIELRRAELRIESVDLD